MRGAVLVRLLPGIIGAGAVLLFSPMADSHCDTLDGPVLTAARVALEKGDVGPVLKWVKKEHEKEVRRVFNRTLKVREKGSEARELADMYLFETLVRLHRAGEGAPYSGLKPAGTDPGPAVKAADKALETDSVEDVVKLLTEAAAEGIRHRFALALEKKKNAEKSVEAGREFVEAYVEFVHYVERLHLDAAGEAPEHNPSEPTEMQGHRK